MREWTFHPMTTVAVVLGGLQLFTASHAVLASNTGTLNGQVGAIKGDREPIAPESASVFILFTSPMDGGSFSHANDPDTAGGQFQEQINGLLAKNKDLKNLVKRARQNPGPGDRDEIAAYYLNSVDDSLAWVRNWLVKHPDRNWQMVVVTPDAKGFWSIGDLRPGGYQIIVRGMLPGYDADWEGIVDLGPGKTISLPLTQPRFFRHR